MGMKQMTRCSLATMILDGMFLKGPQNRPPIPAKCIRRRALQTTPKSISGKLIRMGYPNWGDLTMSIKQLFLLASTYARNLKAFLFPALVVFLERIGPTGFAPVRPQEGVAELE